MGIERIFAQLHDRASWPPPPPRPMLPATAEDLRPAVPVALTAEELAQWLQRPPPVADDRT